ncbi:MAG: hypothetical protein Q4A52_00510 [Bacillota bacterium]|nr:hypothetical protein [Bacillota bacterium]
MKHLEFTLTNAVGGFSRLPLSRMHLRADHALLAVSRTSSGDFFQLIKEMPDRLLLLDDGGTIEAAHDFDDPLIVNRYGAISIGYHVGGNTASGAAVSDDAAAPEKPRYSNAGKQLCMPHDLPPGTGAVAFKYMVNNTRDNRWLELSPSIPLAVFGAQADCVPLGVVDPSDAKRSSSRSTVWQVENDGHRIVVQGDPGCPGLLIVSNFALHAQNPEERSLTLRHPLRKGTNFLHLIFASFRDENQLRELKERFSSGGEPLEHAIQACFDGELLRADHLLEDAGYEKLGEGSILYPEGEGHVKIVSKHPKMHGDPEDALVVDCDATLLRLFVQALDDVRKMASYGACRCDICQDPAQYEKLAWREVEALVGERC